MDLRPKLLRVDGTAGLLAGVVVLALSGWLSELYDLPQNLLIFTGVVNLIYGSFSTTLASFSDRPKKLIFFLIFANLAWSVVCFALAINFFNTASLFGKTHLIGEGLFVGGLGVCESRWRELLLRA